MDEFLISYGYYALILGILIEGEAMLIAASFAAHRGYLSLSMVIFIAFAFTTLLDWGYFLLGRRKGKRYLENKPRIQKKIKRIYDWLERNPYGMLLSFRFIYGFRILIPILLGTTSVNTTKFMFFSMVSTLAWALVYGIAGYYLGAVLTMLISDIEHYEKRIVITLVALGLIYSIFKWLFKKKGIPI